MQRCVGGAVASQMNHLQRPDRRRIARFDGIQPALSVSDPSDRHGMNKRIRKKRMRQLLLVELATLFSNPDDAIQWLETPLDEFEGRSPRETLAAGEAERVALLLDELNGAKQTAS